MSTLDENGPPDRGISRRIDATPTGCVIVVFSIVGGIVIGSVVAAALDISGVGQILICSAAIFALTWVVVGALILSKRPTMRR